MICFSSLGKFDVNKKNTTIFKKYIYKKNWKEYNTCIMVFFQRFLNFKFKTLVKTLVIILTHLFYYNYISADKQKNITNKWFLF